jgi:hypothetical protein
MSQIENMRTDIQVVEDIGDRILAPGEHMIIGMHNRPGSIQVSIEATASYMVSVSQASRSKVEGDTAMFIPVEGEDLSESSDFYIKQGGFIKIENSASSAGSITVDWRV